MPRVAPRRLQQQLQRITQEVAYSDLAMYYEPASSEENLDEYGQPTATVGGRVIPCNFNEGVLQTRGWEEWLSQMDVQVIDAEIRFGPNLITPNKGGRFELLAKADASEYEDKIFEIADVKDRGPMGWVCALKKVDV